MNTSSCASAQRLEAQARVCSVKDGWLKLELAPAVPCAGCRGLCMWSLSRRPTHVSVPRRSTPLTIGDRLTLSVSGAVLLKAALLAYGLPLVSMLLGATLLGLGQSDYRAVVGALLGLGAGLALGRWAQRGVIGRVIGELDNWKKVTS